jgi:fibronectin type 3 domain-containing protein
MSGELNGYLNTFNATLNLLPPTGYPTIFAANLEKADANAGPQIENSGYMTQVLDQAQEMKAMGAQAVMIQIGFPAMYQPFFGTTTAAKTQYNEVVTFYQNLATSLHAMGMKVIVENDTLLANDDEAGWSNLTAYFSTLNWTEYVAGRAAMAATIASTVQPDYLVVAEEPDTEATQSGQANVDIPGLAASMVSQEVAAVRALNLPNVKVGAGFGSWTVGLLGVAGYLEDYLAIAPALDYIDFHIYPINSESGQSFLTNALTIATTANLAGIPVAMSETWMWKMENAEWQVTPIDTIRARNAFSFWGPQDAAWLQTLHVLASRFQMLYQAPEIPYALFEYQTYGGTTGNGGDATCTCTTTTCSNSQIHDNDEVLTGAANQQSEFSTTGISYYNLLVAPPDTTPPSTPPLPTGSAGYNSANIAWTASSDNIGVAGYNIYRDGVYYAQTSETTFDDSGLTAATTYTYQTQAFDVAGNTSRLSTVLSLTTADNLPPTSPTNVVATATSGTQISVTWTPPSGGTATSYSIFRGTNVQSLPQVATRGTCTNPCLFNDYPLIPGTTYYYGIEARVLGNISPMSVLASATTYPLPTVPTSVTATATSDSQIKVTWAPSNGGGLPISTYSVLEGTTLGLLHPIATVNSTVCVGSTCSYVAKSLTSATTYYYEVQASDSGGGSQSLPSSPVAAITPAVPNAPAGLEMTATSATKISVSWSETLPPGGLSIARYQVFCGTSPNPTAQVGTTTNPSYTYINLTPGTTYYCAVEAVDTDNDDSAHSTTASVSTHVLPETPTNLAAVANTSTRVTVTWTASTVPPNGLPIANYQIYRGTTPTGLSNVATRTATSYIDTTVTAGVTYYYALVAVDTGQDDSPRSTTVMVTTP